jgi:hypothetical protein
VPLVFYTADFQGSFLIGNEACSDFQGSFNILTVEDPLLIKVSVVAQHYLPRYSPDPLHPGLYIYDPAGDYVKNPDPSEFVTRYSPDPENEGQFIEDTAGIYVEDPATPDTYILRLEHPTKGRKVFIPLVEHPNAGKYKTYAEILAENGVILTDA